MTPDLFLYVTLVVLGFIVGYRVAKKSRKYSNYVDIEGTDVEVLVNNAKFAGNNIRIANGDVTIDGDYASYSKDKKNHVYNVIVTAKSIDTLSTTCDVVLNGNCSNIIASGTVKQN
jgi:hypothetical protein